MIYKAKAAIDTPGTLATYLAALTVPIAPVLKISGKFHLCSTDTDRCNLALPCYSVVRGAARRLLDHPFL